MPIRRIPPVLHPTTGNPLEMTPPAGGSWIRDADGGLTPADEATARSAGLWVEPAPEPESAVPPATVTPKKPTTKE